MSLRDVIVIGASAGGVPALRELCAQFPADLPAAVFVVLHLGSHPSELAEVLRASGSLDAVHPHDGETPANGKIYVAPPDRHMLLQNRKIRLTQAPKEHHTRPAIDPLFKSAAISCGNRVIGIVLSGYLDDGAAGLATIKQCGGLAMVQDPIEADVPDMPSSALATVAVDCCAGVNQLAVMLRAWVGQPARDFQ